MAGTDKKLIANCLSDFGQRYLDSNILQEYPEVKILPAYIKAHLADAETVLDLGFGTGLWFWASFLPRLERIDGFDLYPEALSEADRILTLDRLPGGYRVAHAQLGETYTWTDLQALVKKRGYLVIQDYRECWPAEIANTRYDLVTEHGGGLAELSSEQEFMEVVQKCGRVLKRSGRMFFANFVMKQLSDWEKRLSPERTLKLGMELYARAVAQAGMRLVDFHELHQPEDMPEVQTFFFGYAEKMSESPY